MNNSKKVMMKYRLLMSKMWRFLIADKLTAFIFLAIKYTWPVTIKSMCSAMILSPKLNLLNSKNHRNAHQLQSWKTPCWSWTSYNTKVINFHINTMFMIPKLWICCTNCPSKNRSVIWLSLPMTFYYVVLIMASWCCTI